MTDERIDSVTAWSCTGEAQDGRLTLDIGAVNARVGVDALPSLDAGHPAARLSISGEELTLDVELTPDDAEQLAAALEAAVAHSAEATR